MDPTQDTELKSELTEIIEQTVKHILQYCAARETVTKAIANEQQQPSAKSQSPSSQDQQCPSIQCRQQADPEQDQSYVITALASWYCERLEVMGGQHDNRPVNLNCVKDRYIPFLLNAIFMIWELKIELGDELSTRAMIDSFINHFMDLC